MLASLPIILAFSGRDATVDAAVGLTFAALYGRGWREILHSTARDMAKRQTRSRPDGFDIDAGSRLDDEIKSVRAVFAELAD